MKMRNREFDTGRRWEGDEMGDFTVMTIQHLYHD